MTTEDFKKAVDEIKANGGIRETMYIKQTWKNRCMTIFGYADGTAEVFESTHPFMAFNSVAEAVLTLNKMQADYNKQEEESNARWSNNINLESITLANYYGRRGVYYGD